jgi:hypothetical protein
MGCRSAWKMAISMGASEVHDQHAVDEDVEVVVILELQADRAAEMTSAPPPGAIKLRSPS